MSLLAYANGSIALAILDFVSVMLLLFLATVVVAAAMRGGGR